MKIWKEKLQEFYNKNYIDCPHSGVWINIASGDVVNVNMPKVSRVDGKVRNTKVGLQQIKKIKNIQIETLNSCGIWYINNFFDFKKIANYFNNDTAPVLKKQCQRNEWANN